MDLGEAFVLDDKDETPFNRFGSVKPGEVVPTLYNNLVRAPIFKHKPPQRDFLVVKCASSCNNASQKTSADG